MEAWEAEENDPQRDLRWRHHISRVYQSIGESGKRGKVGRGYFGTEPHVSTPGPSTNAVRVHSVSKRLRVLGEDHSGMCTYRFFVHVWVSGIPE